MSDTAASTTKNYSPFHNFKSDLPASVVVFLVALPLCLGIALASGAPPIGGLLAGIVGGIVVGSVSKSPLGVSGPAAGLAVIVLNAIQDLGSYELFLCAVVLGGVFQIIFGTLRAGVLAYYFPASVIKGMLAAVGIIIILKQIPHAFGYNKDPEGSMSFAQPDEHNTLSTLGTMLDYINMGSILITSICLGLIVLWEQPIIKKSKLKAVPGPLLAVITGVVLGVVFNNIEALRLHKDFYVSLPDVSLNNMGAMFTTPDMAGFSKPEIWKAGLVIAIVASLETLLCVEATDKLDPERRVTPTNREVFAQGVGNTLSGFIGGLPITQVIVRSSANIQSGARTQASAVVHGFLLLLCLLLIPGVLRMVPLAALAAILLVVGSKLAKPSLIISMWKGGKYQAVPFFVTIFGVVFTDLLTGVMIGLATGIGFILYKNYKVSFHYDPEDHEPGEPIKMILSEDVSFLNKASLQQTLAKLPKGTHVVIDGTNIHELDPDIDEVIKDAAIRAPHQGVKLETVGFEVVPPRRVGSPSAFYEHVKELHDSQKMAIGQRQANDNTEASEEDGEEAKAPSVPPPSAGGEAS